MSRTLLAALLLAGLASPAHADILVGNYGGGKTPESLHAFADDANGDAAPIRALGGPASTLVSAAGGSYEANEGVLYVADFFGQAIRVYPAYANGDVAPLRVLDAPLLGQVRSVAIDVAHDELLTTNSGCCLAAYPRTASGTDYPLRSLSWGGIPGSQTQLNYPSSIAYAPGRDEVLLADSDAGGPKILVFDRGQTDAYAPPRRVLKGNLTGFGDWIGGIALDPGNHLLYVATYTTNPDATRSGRILVFADDAGGNVAPLRTIAGPSTQLDTANSAFLFGLAVDPLRRRLIASVQDGTLASGNALLVWSLDASGDAAPLQAIRGNQTGMLAIGAPIWVPADAIFADSFD
ncbi:MAG: hypothetical protein GXC76_09880 [Rhodanobacteraceae bacterium]|jgi:hypothetical protein|nr:hypothetical protein [Rhodanobacteraceae bacterium]